MHNKNIGTVTKSLYTPNNVIITPGANGHPRAQEMLKRIKVLDPLVSVTYSSNELPKYSGCNTYEDRFHRMKETVVLGERKSSFIEIFVSPGRIFEKMGTMIKSVSGCAIECKFCYLQTTAIRHYRQKIYVNYELVEDEIKNEFIIDPIFRSTLSIVTKLTGTQFNKIPGGFNVVCNKIRDELSRMGRNVVTEDDARNYLKTNLMWILADLGVEFERKQLRPILKNLDHIFDENKKIKPTFVISEYCDLLAVDHISDQLQFYMGLISKYPELKLSFRTKSANVDRFIKYDGMDRVVPTIQLDTQYVIDNYQIGTSSLTERIKAIQKIQAATGFILKIAIEPIIMYKGFEKDYLNLIDLLAKSIDMSKVDNFDIGGLRASKNLQTCLLKNYPGTNLLNLQHPLEQPVGEKKWRYPMNERIKIYKSMIDKIRIYTNSRIVLAAENPEAWKKSGLTIPSANKFFYKIK